MGKSIAYFANGIGNFIMMMPALQAVASLSDDQKVDIVIHDNWSDHRRPVVIEICKAWSPIGKVIRYPSERFSRNGYVHWFFTVHGEVNGMSSIFLPKMHKIIPKPHWRSSGVHEADYYMDIARGIGYEGNAPNVQFPLSDYPILDLPKPIIGICNGYFRTSTNYWDKKGWPHFVELSETLLYYFWSSVVSLGRENEIPKETKLTKNYAGSLSILETAKVISQLDLLITTDTGLMHLGNILNVPMLAMFGPTLVTKNGPRSMNSHVLQADMKCLPCQDTSAFYTCKFNECMRSISVGDVMIKSREVLSMKEKSNEWNHYRWPH